jgi:hypothetical protein
MNASKPPESRLRIAIILLSINGGQSIPKRQRLASCAMPPGSFGIAAKTGVLTERETYSILRIGNSKGITRRQR